MKYIFQGNLSLRKQLIYGITLVHAVLMTIFVVDTYYRQKQFLISNAAEDATELAETIANNSISWVIANDLVGLQEIVTSQKTKSKVNDVMVISNENKILAHSDLTKVGKYIIDSEIKALLTNKNIVEVVGPGTDWVGALAPIQVQNRFIGRVYVSLNLIEMNNALMDLIRNGLSYTLLAIVIGAIFAWFMAKYLTKGIEALTDISTRIKEGQRGLRAKVFKKDEVGQLVEDFNSMLDAVESKEKNLLAIQESLAAAKEQAESAGKSKANFLANMSHELRTPLNAVVGFCEVLADTHLEAEQMDFLFRIKNSGQVLQYLIDDILEFSRVESAKIHLDNVPFNLASEIKKVVEMHELKLRQKNLKFNLVLAPSIPNIVIGDAFRLNQILNNLLSNAIKFTSSGGVSLSVELNSEEGQANQNQGQSQDQTQSQNPSPNPNLNFNPNARQIVQLNFKITDTGIGIRKEQIQCLFNPFTQADATITKKYGGTGLGLAISRRLAQLMNGDIRVESEYGIGSTFILTVQLEGMAERAVANLKAKEVVAKDIISTDVADNEATVNLTKVKKISNLSTNTIEGLSDILAVFKNKTVLIVDDNLMNLEVAGLTLRKFGLNTLFAENGREAIDIIEKKGKEINLVLMDLQMPILDGFKATEIIRSLPQGQGIPIVAFSARAFDSDLEKCFESGMNDHIAKPFDRQELLLKLKKYLAV